MAVSLTSRDSISLQTVAFLPVSNPIVFSIKFGKENNRDVFPRALAVLCMSVVVEILSPSETR
jgi:hypothetical protein